MARVRVPELTALDWIAAGGAVLGAAYLAAFPFTTAPRLASVLRDLGGDPPLLTRLALTPWFPLGVALAASALLGVASRATLRGWRLLVAASFLASYVAGMVLREAVWMPFLPLLK